MKLLVLQFDIYNFHFTTSEQSEPMHWVFGRASRVPAEKYRWPVNKENVSESVRYKADESRGEGA